MMRERMGLRAVLDTNVYLSVFIFPEEKMFEVWRLAREGRYTLIVSPFVIRELMEKLRDKFGVPEKEREEVKRRVIRIAEVVQPKTIRAVITEDPDDDHVLACALDGKANIIVSGNKHLLRLKEYKDIPIVRPRDFLRMIGS